jgi:class 3 adenylate cyclase
VPVCPACGEDNPERARYCLACGSSLALEVRTGREVRKTVSIVFCDVTGSTSLGERLDPESLRRVMTRYFDEMRAALERHGGTVEKFIGDAVMAVFGIPSVHEDDALRAVRAAHDMRSALADLNKELERDRGVTIASRIGVNTGPVVAGDPDAGQALVTGDAVNIAARLEQAAQPGEVLIGEETWRLVRDAVETEATEPLTLKGKAGPIAAFRLLDVSAGAAGVARRLDAPMIGRDQELGLLRQAFERATSERACNLFTVLGTAGVGKSRLLEEFLLRVRDAATVIRGRCLSYGEGITLWPLAEAVSAGAGVTALDPPDAVREGLVAVVGEDRRTIGLLEQVLGIASADAAPEELARAIRVFLERLASERPLVVVFDDVHWGEPTFLDVVEHVADRARDVPILLVCQARPELLDVRAGWGVGS